MDEEGNTLGMVEEVRRLYTVTFLLGILIGWSCQSDTYPQPSLPSYFPAIMYPSDNEPTKSRVALGELLFFDKSLSLDSSISCGSCHLPERAFTDGQVLSPGVNGRLGKRNTPSLLNVGYLNLINKDGGVRKLDLQALVPIEDENEMAIPILDLSARLVKNQYYQDLSRKAYDQDIGPFTITRALASFVRTLYSFDSPYDRYLQGDSAAMTDAAKRGLALFESKALNCQACHGGFNFTNNEFENNGLYDDYKDLGRALITLDSSDQGKFRVPSLRNVAITAPYMHDGSVPTLDSVIMHYEQLSIMPKKGQSEKLNSFSLTKEERLDLISFLRALTDSNFLRAQARPDIR